MNELNNIIDVVTTDSLLALAEVEGPCISIFIPTSEFGTDTRQSQIVLKNLLAEARDTLLDDLRRPHVEELLSAGDELVDDPRFWQVPDVDVAIFIAPNFRTTFRVPSGLHQSIHIGDTFAVAQLAPNVSGDGIYFVLAISQNDVRLFAGTRHRIGEIDLSGVPTSLEEALPHDDREPQLQGRSGGGAGAMFHGHDPSITRVDIERYFNVVDEKITDIIRPTGDHPIVLATVAANAPLYRNVARLNTIVDEVIEGSPDELPARDLHAAAWPIVEPVLAASADDAAAAYHQQIGTGLASNDPETILTYAEQGRVATLFLADAEPDQIVEDIVWATLKTGGALWGAQGSIAEHATPVAAVFRY